MQLGVRLEEELEGLEPTDDVLRGIGAIDTYDQELRSRLEDEALMLENARVLAQFFELGDVDRNRSRADARSLARVGDRRAVRAAVPANASNFNPGP